MKAALPKMGAGGRGGGGGAGADQCSLAPIIKKWPNLPAPFPLPS